MTTPSPFPSRIPQLDKLEELLKSPVSNPPGAVAAAFRDLDEVLGYLYGQYDYELQFLEYSEPVAEVCDQLLEAFQTVKPIQAAIRDELSLGHNDAALHLLQELRSELDAVFEGLARLKSLMEEGPTYSELPFTQELLRVAYLYLEERLPLAAVQSRLDVFCNYHENLELELARLQPSPSEQQAFEQRKEDLIEAMALQLQGIEDLDLALERDSDEGIREALELLAEAGSALLEVYQTLRRADLEPDMVTCFRCGTDNSTQARLCGGCSAVLPRPESALPTSTLEFSEQGEGATAGTPEGYLTIERAVEQAIDGHDPSILQEALDSLAQKIELNLNRLERMKPPPADLPAEQLAVLQQGKAEFQAALARLNEAVALLDEGAHGLEQTVLMRGLEELKAGFDQFAGFQEAFQRAEEITS